MIGYQKQKQDIETALADIRRQLGAKSIPGLGPLKKVRKQSKHRISAEGRARIAAAQKKRWAAAKKAQR